MRFTIAEDELGMRVTLDEEGLDFLEEGLSDLRRLGPDGEVSSPSLVSNDGEAKGVGTFTLHWLPSE